MMIEEIIFKLYEELKVGRGLSWVEFWYGERNQSLDESLRGGDMKPDKEKMADYADRLADQFVPALQNAGAKDFLIDCEFALTEICNKLRRWEEKENVGNKD